ncbi:MAG: hypothetical protein ACI87A_000848 [Planctomycetota bacterium]|jgi:hypothetical protein
MDEANRGNRAARRLGHLDRAERLKYRGGPIYGVPMQFDLAENLACRRSAGDWH